MVTSRVVILKIEKSQYITCFWSIRPITWWKYRSCKFKLISIEKKLKYSTALHWACSVVLSFLGKMASSRWGATESKLCIQVHIISFSITPIRNHLIILIKDGSNLIIFYFIQQLRIAQNWKTFRNCSNWGGIVPNNVQLYAKLRVCTLSSRTCYFI